MVKTVVLLAREPFVVMAMGGVWQFLDSDSTGKAVADRLLTGGSVRDAARFLTSAMKSGEAPLAEKIATRRRAQ